MLGMLGAGVMITGGCSRLSDIASVAEDIFDLPVQLTRAREVGGSTQIFENPQFSTAIGLTKYAMAVSDSLPEESFLQRLAEGLGGLFRRRSR
jgi:cell division protein FtsA